MSDTKLCFTCGIRPRHVSKKGKSQSYCYECATERSRKSKQKNYGRERDYSPNRQFRHGKLSEPPKIDPNDPMYKIRIELLESRHQMAVLRKAAIQAVLNQDLTELETILSPYLGEKALQ